MTKIPLNRLILIPVLLAGGWIFIRFGLPVLLPFLLGAGLALAAEPLAGVLERRIRLPRAAASGIAVTAVFVLLIAVATLLIALILREAGQLARILPDLTDAVRQGLSSLENWLLELSASAPSGIRPVLTNTVTSLFSGSGATMDRVTDKLLGIVTGLFSAIAGSALTVATGVLAAFMISARLPRLRSAIAHRMPPAWQETYRPALQDVKSTLLGWLSAQLKLSGITALELLAGFWLLRIPYWPVWALMVTLVDAFPVLGTGTVLIPWSILCLLQGQTAQGAGLLGLYAVVWLMRSILEPKLLGRELGLDSLTTLLAMYAGYKLLGLPGMLLSPMLAVVATRLLKAAKKDEKTGG
ncbi:MAG: sporulation integral membrane protein YtvI [Oscillospiraceae bacterium]|nr:sporulation integral membrane protein YtvI [Oscillospiraceae bacterium]